jgi:transcriptional regulator with XRE-family HTH domain
MEPDEIYKNLKEKGLSARLIADALNVTNQSVSEVIRHGRGSKRIAEAIAKLIGKPLITVFPYYTPKAERKDKVISLRKLLQN